MLRGRPPTMLSVLALAATVHAGAALASVDMAAASYSPIRAPDCIDDPSGAFIVQNAGDAAHPSLPSDHFYLLVRHMGPDATGAPAAFDFGRVPDDYAWTAKRGQALTGLTVPAPRERWQRALRPDSDLDSSSAFQMHCADAGSYINTWHFDPRTIVGGGPHAIYGYSFFSPPPPLVYDPDGGNDVVLQASVEVPWFMSWADASPAALYAPVGQVSIFAYFRSRTNARAFGLVLAIFDNRGGESGGYAPFVDHDTFTPFASTPIDDAAIYAKRSPFSSSFTGLPWTGLRFYRAHLGVVEFRRILDDINRFCAQRREARFCDDRGDGTAFETDPGRYEITDFGVLHEVFRGGPAGQVSMGMHVNGLSVWKARAPQDAAPPVTGE